MIKKNDPILVFEYFTASGEKDKSIISEAEALIFALLDDLKEYNIDLLINKSYENIVKEYANINPILIDTPVDFWLKNNDLNFSNVIFIAAEHNNKLYEITKILEENNINTYTSSSYACFKSSDKYETYTELLNIVPQPKTVKLKIDSEGTWINYFKNLYKKWNVSKLIIKPLIGVDCEGVIIIDESINDLENILPVNSHVIVQEYIKGKDVSVSIISNGTESIPISLNEQYINLNNDNGSYIGGKLPYETSYENSIFKIATKAVNSIKGIKGFVGVDLIIGEDNNIYLLEINSRFTTPYVGLKKIANFNIASSIIKLINNEINITDLHISLDGKVEFRKSENKLEIRRTEK